MRLLVSFAVALVAAACGATGPDPERGTDPPAEEPASVLYEANATVLEAGSRGPMLCLGGMATSLPPQCGDVPLVGWDWEAVEGEETYGGTTWGGYRLVGSYDGETFTVVEVGPFDETAPGAFGDEPSREPACPEPDDGWPVGDPEARSYEDAGAAQAYAAAQPDYVASWVHPLVDPSRPVEDQREHLAPVVYNAVFTGDAERHEEEIRRRWDGPLCVVERDLPTEREARQIRADAEASLEELGLRMLWSDEGGLEQAARIGVVADPGGAGQEALDARFGPGVVRLFPALRPVG